MPRKQRNYLYSLRLAWCDSLAAGSASASGGGGSGAGGAQAPAQGTGQAGGAGAAGGAGNTQASSADAAEKARVAAELKAEKDAQAAEFRQMKRELAQLRKEKVDARAREMLGLNDPVLYEHPYIQHEVNKSLTDGALDEAAFASRVEGLKKSYPQWFGASGPGGLPVHGVQIMEKALTKYIDDGGSKLFFRLGDFAMDQAAAKAKAQTRT